MPSVCVCAFFPILYCIWILQPKHIFPSIKMMVLLVCFVFLKCYGFGSTLILNRLKYDFYVSYVYRLIWRVCAHIKIKSRECFKNGRFWTFMCALCMADVTKKLFEVRGTGHSNGMEKKVIQTSLNTLFYSLCKISIESFLGENSAVPPTCEHSI